MNSSGPAVRRLIEAAFLTERVSDEHLAKLLTLSHEPMLAWKSNHLIAFDYLIFDDTGAADMFALIAPPSSVGHRESVLRFADMFAKGREFFDDDPKIELAHNGLEEAIFSEKRAWDGFGLVQNLLKIWNICERFITAFVDNTYRDDLAVAADTKLNDWMVASAVQGNIRGLPKLDNKAALTRLLTSLIYRITAHGVGRLQRDADPWLTFVANFPPCLQRTDLPRPSAPLGTRELLKYLPEYRHHRRRANFLFCFRLFEALRSVDSCGRIRRGIVLSRWGLRAAQRRAHRISGQT